MNRYQLLLLAAAILLSFTQAESNPDARRAKPLTETDRIFAARRETLEQERRQRLAAIQAEIRDCKAVADRLRQQGAYIDSMPLSDYKIQELQRLNSEWDRVNDWADRIKRKQADCAAWIEEATRPQPKPPSSISRTEDCLIVATETYARLKNTATFVKIVGLRVVMKTGTKPSNHAVVFYQPAADANVFLFDRSGSYDLLTRSHDLPELQEAAVQRSKAPGSLMPYEIQSAKWIQDEATH